MTNTNTDAERGELRAELDALHRRGHSARVARATRRALPRAIETGLWAAAALPIALALAALAARLGGPHPRDFGVLPTLIGMLSIAIAVIAVRLLIVRSRPIDRTDLLGECDRLLESGGRLVAADDFVRTAASGPFVAAALEDARTSLDRARELRFPFDDQFEGVRARALVAGILALLLAWFVTTGERTLVDQIAESESSRDSALEPVLDRKSADAPSAAETPSAPESRPELQPQPLTRGARAETAQDGTPPTDQVKDSKGRTQGGRSSAAQSSSGAGASRGAPSSQAQESEKSEEASKPGKQPKAGQAEDPENDSKREEDASGATAGRGSGSGSTKNPSTSDWTSKDQIEAQPDADQGDDADVDDEDSDSEARGGVQPSLRDRRPPVNRDLLIGFAAGRPEPDANGRGGPSPQKKSRGVASLVLGVPIPDHIKGRANPGRTKVTQERVEPEAEDANPAVAEARRARENSAGHIERHELTPWMRELVRNYFKRAPVAAENEE